jgi:hypothetical protein
VIQQIFGRVYFSSPRQAIDLGLHLPGVPPPGKEVGRLAKWAL